MCVDQPVGSGFSYNNGSQQVSTSREAASHFINFLYNFYKNNPKLNLGQNPLYLAGESFAGHFIPIIADMILTNS
jgi:carboxypeptidase C (cathepsin A)